jgi:hypothetical protein
MAITQGCDFFSPALKTELRFLAIWICCKSSNVTRKPVASEERGELPRFLSAS